MQTRLLMLGGVAVIAGASAFWVWRSPPEIVPVVQDEPPPALATDSAEVTGSPERSDATAASDGAAIVPNVTEMRFEPDGGLVLSGTAAPSVVLALMVNEVEAERAIAAADGSFVFIGFLGYSDAPRRIALIADPDGAALEADRSFVLDANPAPEVVAAVPVETPPEPTPEPLIALDAQTEPLVVLDAEPVPMITAQNEAGSDAAPEPELEPEPAPEPQIVRQTEPEPEPEPEPELEPEQTALQDVASTSASPAILAIDEGGVNIVQAPIAAGSPPEVMTSVALDTITYDPAGEVVLTGRAFGDGFVQVYLNNAPINRLAVAPDGSWRTDLPDLDKGVYTLRIDEVDSEGDVLSRIETPFQREDPDDLADAMAEQTADPQFTLATRTVQPGATLWAIAKERYGSGVQYVTVFEANRDRIRDPDLIYPGQVFILPPEAE